MAFYSMDFCMAAINRSKGIFGFGLCGFFNDGRWPIIARRTVSFMFPFHFEYHETFKIQSGTHSEHRDGGMRWDLLPTAYGRPRLENADSVIYNQAIRF
jgi:hypothetical protein